MVVAQGFGPKPFRYALIAFALLYYVLLLHPPQNPGKLRPVIFFMQATALFPRADVYALEYRIQGWSCREQAWKPMDPSPYFPIQADDKESRLQRVAYFYSKEKAVLYALDKYIVDMRKEENPDDGIVGPIGGIKLMRLDTVLPEPGDDVVRYAWNPLGAVPEPAPDCSSGEHLLQCNLFYAPTSLRKKRCESTTTP